MIKQPNFSEKVYKMKKIVSKLFKPSLRNQQIKANTYRLLSMNRRLTLRQGK